MDVVSRGRSPNPAAGTGLPEAKPRSQPQSGAPNGVPVPVPGGASGADGPAARRHMDPGVSPAAGVGGAVTQETCDRRIVARLGEGSNRAGVLSAD